MRIENAAIAEGNAFTDAAEGANGDVLTEFGGGVDDGCWVNQFVFQGEGCFEIANCKMQNANLRFEDASRHLLVRKTAKPPQISDLHFAICNFKAPFPLILQTCFPIDDSNVASAASSCPTQTSPFIFQTTD